MAAMDKIDRKILAVLQADARASLQEIGQAVGLSPSPCWGRIKKMEEAGVIQGYTVRINPQALDLADTVLVQVTLDSHSDNTLEKFGETLASIPEVIEAHLVSGDYDYLLRIVVKDTRDYERLLREKLYKIKGIRHSRSSFVLRLTERIVAEQKLTTMMVTHSMRQALDVGERTVMLHQGQVVLDVSGDERKRLDVPDLLQMFEKVRGEKLADDALLLGLPQLLLN